MQNAQNSVFLRGCVHSAPVFSHESHGHPYYLFEMLTRRLSGAGDILRVLAGEDAIARFPCKPQTLVAVEGSLRSFDNKTGFGSKLIITVLAHALSEGSEPHENKVLIAGTLCKAPIYRKTPLGREICDLILAVGRPYGRADYLPCITWGAGARKCAAYAVGEHITIEGRFQSRAYVKVIDGEQIDRTAYEVSAANIRLTQESVEYEG